jgi:hypothetical protein
MSNFIPDVFDGLVAWAQRTTHTSRVLDCLHAWSLPSSPFSLKKKNKFLHPLNAHDRV